MLERETPNGNGRLSPDPSCDCPRLSFHFDDNEPLDAERRPRLHLHLLLARCPVSVSKNLRPRHAHDVCVTTIDDTFHLHRQPGHRKCAQKISRGSFSPVFGQLVHGCVSFESFWVGCRLNRGLGYRRLYESPGVYSHTSTAISGEMSPFIRPPRTEPQTLYYRHISRHISSSSTSAYWANIFTTENSLHQLRRIFERAPCHSVEEYLKIEAITEASPSQLQMSPPPRRSWLPIKRSRALVYFTGSLGALMKPPNRSDHLSK